MGMTQQMSQTSQMQPQLMTQIGSTAAAAMLQYPQAQMFQQTQLGQLQQVGDGSLCFMLNLAMNNEFSIKNKPAYAGS